MTLPSLTNLPAEILYLIFEYLSHKDIVDGFIELNSHFLSLVKYFLGQHLDLSTIRTDDEFRYCLTRVLPLIGMNIQTLTFNSSFSLLTLMKTIKITCPHLKHLKIICSSTGEDIRHLVKTSLHRHLKSLTLIYNGEITHRSLAQRLLNRCQNDESFQNDQIASDLTFHLSSTNDFLLLKRFCQSEEIFDGIYMIQSSATTDRWLTETDEDLCLLPADFNENYLFAIRQIDPQRSPLEYEITHLSTGRLLSVLINDECAEYFPPTSILSTQRKLTPRTCSKFTFERNDDEHDDDDEDFYIRPFYDNAKRLQQHGRRIIVSIETNETTLNHRFKLHRLS